MLLRDPTALKLARYANPSIDWDGIRATPDNIMRGNPSPGWEARHRREFLFVSRLQTHLMVAIAAACQGLANFASGRVGSALVRATDVPPSTEGLASHWLGHMTGSYDHRTECADLLQSVARHYAQDLSSGHLRGVPIPPYRASSAPIEASIATPRPYLHGCITGDAFDAYRWNLFDASLDDASVIRWGREAADWVETGGLKKPVGTS